MKRRLIISMALSGLLIVPTVLAQTIYDTPTNSVPVIQKEQVPAPKEHKGQKTFVPAPTPKSNITRPPAQSIPTGAPTVITKDVIYNGSDPLAIGDPLGSHAPSAKDDAGPPLTQRLPYGHSCSHDACIRAQRRWDSGGSWRDDKASGMSKGWGGESKSNIAPKSSQMKSESPK